jgi:putative nucleotidyltransferase with HDIG domain
MTQPPVTDISLSELRLGHYVILDLGWMAHPFPRSSFLVTSERELDTLRSLKIKRVRVDLSRSEFLEDEAPPATGTADATATDAGSAAATSSPPQRPPDPALAGLDVHRAAQERAERHFQEGARCFKSVTALVDKQPEAAAAQAQAFVNGLLTEMSSHGESAIRLLDQVMGDRHAQHAVNVMVLCLLLGKAVGLSEAEIDGLGQAAFLHDVGKLKLPTPVRNLDDSLTPAQRKAYESHVAHGVDIGRSMKLANPVLQAIAQHHEAVDGTGFPTGCKGERISRQAQVLALVNRYDGLCNPWNPARALTPHEAVSRLFASSRARFDTQVLQAFIRMMGVYPPGSIVQLSDGRFAQVHVVNASRPLKPTLLVHAPGQKEQPFQVVDLAQLPSVSVQRSLRADQLPRAVLDDLAPRARYCYFFERAVQGTGSEGPAA